MKRIINSALLVLLPILTAAQPMTYESFFRNVLEKNAGYIAEKYNIDIADANLQAAKVFNDPEISVSYGNNQDWNLQMGQSVEAGLSYDLDLSGVRRARVGVADGQKSVTEASVAAYLCNLRLEAAQAWADAWKLKKNCDILEASVDAMMQIADSDSLRLTVGDVGLTDATQSRLEARTLQGDLIAMRAEYVSALKRLSFLCGDLPVESIVDDDLAWDELPYDEEQLCMMAERNRADLKAAELSCTLSEKELALVKATRSFDMGVNLGYSYNTEVRNEIAPAPIYHGLSVGVSIPLKFSSMNRGEIKAAESRIIQSRQYYEYARSQVRMETSQAFNALQAALAVLAQYDNGLLEDAGMIVESRKSGYLKGQSSLLEYLAAQQTYRDVMQAYVEACCYRYVCQAALEQAVGYYPFEG